jgi:hypothetical protein
MFRFAAHIVGYRVAISVPLNLKPLVRACANGEAIKHGASLG